MVKTKSTHVRSLLKWVGGKTRLAPELVRRLPSDYLQRRHVEPFAGGAALFFALEPGRAILSDTNSRLINTLKTVRSDVEEVISRLRDFEREHCENLYYETRDFLNSDALQGALQAAAFLYLNRTCFNGLWRTNKAGHNNVPMGSYKNPNILNVDALHTASRALQNANMVTADFSETLMLTSANDFVYLDPPYEPLSKTSNFAAYTASGFSQVDQRRLARECIQLDQLGAKWMLSNSDTPLTRELYAPWHVDTVTVQRSVSAFERGRVQELIVRNYTDVKEAS